MRFRLLFKIVATLWLSCIATGNLNAAAPVITRFAVPPGVVDSSSAATLIFVEVDFTADEDLTQIYGSFGASVGSNTQPYFFSYGWLLPRHLTGTPRTGTLRIPLSIPRGLPAGDWSPNIRIYSSGGSRSYTQLSAFPPGSTPLLRVNNTQPPTPTSIHTTADRTSADVSQGAQSITLTSVVENPQGIPNMGCRLLMRGSGTLQSLDPSIRMTRISGNSLNGTYQTTFRVPKHMHPGEYSVEYSTSSTPRAWIPPVTILPGSITSLQVINSAAADTFPPELISMRTVPRTDLDSATGPKEVDLTLTFRDNNSGMAYVIVWLQSAADKRYILSESVLDPTDSTFENGITTRSVTLSIPQYAKAGRCEWGASLTDAVGNQAQYGPHYPTALPLGSDREINISNSGPPPGNLPRVLSITSSTSSLGLNSLPALVELTADLEHDTELFSVKGGLRLENSSYGFPPWARISGNQTRSKWRLRIHVSRNYPLGEYLFWLNASDVSGNVLEIPAWPQSTKTAAFPAYPAGWSAPLLISHGGTALPAYQTWVQGHSELSGPNAAENADADGDGFPNVLEFLCGTDPLLPTQPGGPDPAATRLMWNSQALRMEYQPDSLNASLGSGSFHKILGWKSSSLDATGWTTVNPIPLDEGRMSLPLDPPSAARTRQFLRITVEP